MTIQVAIGNSYALALASDRHVFRGGEARSTGQEVKLLRLRGTVPAAMMASGPFAVFGIPVSRLSLRLERALESVAAEGSPEALAEAVLSALDQPLTTPGTDGLPEADAAVLAEVADDVLESALDLNSGSGIGLESLLAELERAPHCRGGERAEAFGRAVWRERAPGLPELVTEPSVAEALRHAPDLCGRAVIGALSRDWRRASDLFLTVGMCCPATGVPVLVALRLWKGIGGRLHFASRLERDYEAIWKSNRTVVIAQGSGRATVEAMVDGLAEDHWTQLTATDRESLRPGMGQRWDKAHDRIGVSSPRELAAAATGLVRGAEVIGYLTRDGEGSVAEIDCVLLTPRGGTEYTLPAGPELRVAALAG